MTETTDVLIIGAGPAGLGAALSLCRQAHSVIVFGTGKHRNESAAAMHMVSTWDSRSPGEFLAAARAELQALYSDHCVLIDREVRTITLANPVEGSPAQTFLAHDADGGEWLGRKVILATGVRDLLPALDGMDDCWGTGVIHCLFCDGYERRGALSVAILALDAFAEPSTVVRVVRACRRFTDTVRIYTHDNARVAAQLKGLAGLVPGCEIEVAFIERLEMAVSVDREGRRDISVILEGLPDAQTHAFAVYHAGTEQASSLPQRLGVELQENGDIRVGAFQETSVKGVFAAGDCASAEKFVSVASVTGFTAGVGAAQQLQAETRY